MYLVYCVYALCHVSLSQSFVVFTSHNLVQMVHLYAFFCILILLILFIHMHFAFSCWSEASDSASSHSILLYLNDDTLCCALQLRRSFFFFSTITQLNLNNTIGSRFYFNGINFVLVGNFVRFRQFFSHFHQFRRAKKKREECFFFFFKLS